VIPAVKNAAGTARSAAPIAAPKRLAGHAFWRDHEATLKLQ
jgi:hypothetical protein